MKKKGAVLKNVDILTEGFEEDFRGRKARQRCASF